MPGPPPGASATASGPLRSLAARGAVVNAGFSVGAGLLGLIRGFVLAAFLTRSDYGLWGIVVVSLSTLVWLKQAGVGDKFVQRDAEDLEASFQQAFTLDLLLTLGVVAVIALALPVLVAIYHLPQMILPSIFATLALVISVFQAPLWILYRRMEYRRQRSIAAIDPVVSFVVSIALAAAGAGYWAFVGGALAGISAASAAAVAASPYRLRWRYERGLVSEYWSFSGPLLIASTGGFVIAWSAVLTAKLALGVAAVGVIALADNIASFTERVDDLLTGALYPAICAVRERPAVMYESLVKSNRLALMWAVPLGLAITLFCGDLVRFAIGERWRPAVVVMEVFGVVAAVNHVGYNWTAYFRAIDRTRPIAVAALAAAATFVAAGIPLIIVLGLRGFALGIALQALAALLLRAYYLQQLFPGFDFLRHAVRSFLPTVPAVASVLVLRALEPSGRSLAEALGELALYLLVGGIGTWLTEAPLLREARHMLLRPAAERRLA